MVYPPIFVFSLISILIWTFYQLFGKKYALDHPDRRKRHGDTKPQIGGIIFGSFFLIIIGYMKIVPLWYLIGGMISVLLGAKDDLKQAQTGFKKTQDDFTFVLKNKFYQR